MSSIYACDVNHWQAYKCDVSDTELTNKTMHDIDRELGPITGLIAVSTHGYQRLRTYSPNVMPERRRFGRQACV